MSANFGPAANWPCYWTCDDWVTASPTVTGTAVASATLVLWSMTGMRYGLTSVKLRPCRRDCRSTPFPSFGAEPWPGRGLLNSPWGAVIATQCGSCGDTCSCTTLSEVKLPGTVNAVTEVRQDGAVLTPGAQYRLDNNRLLVRTDGQAWPYCQNLRLDDTQPGTFSVTASYGEDIPAAAAPAVGELACEFLRALRGDDCRLPTSLTGLTRQGVSITLPSMADVLDRHRTGIPNVDRFINAVNPYGLRERARTHSVEQALARRTGT